MNMTDVAHKDKLWHRVRMMLGRGPGFLHRDETSTPRSLERRATGARPMDEELHQGWMLSAERNVSLCVMALEIDCFAEYLAAYGRDAAEDCLEQLDQAISALLKRDEDRCLRLGQSGFLLILPDMPALMARELAGRINSAVRQLGLINKESHAGAVTLGQGLVVVNPEPPFDRALLDMARQALRKAQRRGLSRLEVADMREVRREVAAA
jgi:diguanylate cyclase (GGDEF)-like protein